MSVYNTGTITLTGASDRVSGAGTAFLSSVKAGAVLTVSGLRSFYTVIDVIDDATLQIDRPFKSLPGNVYLNVPYTLTTGAFTPALSLPMPSANDLDSARLLNRAWTIIDRELPKT